MPMAVILSVKALVANSGDPTGEPRYKKPSVSSTGIVCPSGLGIEGALTEYVVIACWRAAAVEGSARARAGKMECPLQDVRMRFLRVFMKHPKGLARVLNVWR